MNSTMYVISPHLEYPRNIFGIGSYHVSLCHRSDVEKLVQVEDHEWVGQRLVCFAVVEDYLGAAHNDVLLLETMATDILGLGDGQPTFEAAL